MTSDQPNPSAGPTAVPPQLPAEGIPLGPGVSAPTPLRRRTRAPQRAELPVALRPKMWIALGALALVAWLGQQLWLDWKNSRVTLQVVATDGVDAVPANLEVVVFEYDTEPQAASPTAQLGTLSSASSELELTDALVPREAVVRVSAPGFGAHYAHVDLHKESVRVELGPPVAYAGQVVYRNVDGSYDPIPDALVRAFGGGVRGVLLTTARTDDAGRFVVEGISSTADNVRLQVFAPGYEVDQQGIDIRVETDPVIAMKPTQLVRGVVIVPEGVATEDLEVRVFSVPGVVGRVAADGSFELDHLPPAPTICRLLIANLPAAWTHSKTMVSAGDSGVTVVVEKSGRMSGTVIDAMTRTPLPRAKVFHEQGPNGYEIVDCDQYGRFEIGRVPQGVVRVTADILEATRRATPTGSVRVEKRPRQGWLDIDVREGETISEIALTIE